MIPFNKALNIILNQCQTLGTERKKLEDLAGYATAKPVISKFNSPLFDNSAVDGYGVLIQDLKNIPCKLKLTGAIFAGDKKNIKLKKGSTIKILTGAKIPSGVEAVVMKEFCEESNNFVVFKKTARLGENIRKKGEEYLKGKKILDAGTLINPPIIGLLASLGYSSFLVYKKPKVSVVVTGSELIKPGKKLRPGKIYESNSFSIVSALQGIGINETTLSSVKDNKKNIKKLLYKAIKDSDVIITIGGISVGDKDYVKDVLRELGVKTKFSTVAMKPAKPNYFGVYKKKLVFGLPGNPVSAILSFHELIKPALLKTMGVKNVSGFNTSAILTHNLKKKSGRLEFVRGELIQKNGDLLVTPTEAQGSHMLSGICNANSLIYFPQEKEFLSGGEKVEIELLRWTT